MRRFIVLARSLQSSSPNRLGRWFAALLIIALISTIVAGELKTYNNWYSIGNIQAVVVADELWVFVETDHWSERSGILFRRPYTRTVGGLSVMVFTPFGLRSRYNLTNLSEIDFNPYAQFIHTCDDNIFLYDIGSQGRPPKLFEWQRDDFYPLAKNQKWNVRDHCIVEVMSHKDVNRILATSFNNTFYINIIWDKQKLKMETNSDFKINSKSNNVTLNITAEGPRSNWRITLDTLPTR